MLHDLDLYREFYKADRHRFRDVQWELVLSDDPVIIKRLEAFSKTTQKRAVDILIEKGEFVPRLVGKKGTASERLHAVRAAYLRHFTGSHVQGPPYAVLTPLEYDF